MEFSEAGLALLKQSEGFRSKVYLDVEGFPTIGYGHRLLHPESFPDGVSEEQAAEILLSDLRDTKQSIARLVRVTLTQGQFDALVDFAFNLGQHRLADSTLLAELNGGRYDEAAEQLMCWDHAGTAENAGLKARRKAEYKLWTGHAPVR